MPKGSELAKTGCPYLGTPYSQLDCQAFVERCLDNIGLHKNLAGSNAWYRFTMNNGWVGTPEECKNKFGNIPPGAFLFILEHNGKEPEKYRQDGIGNASHIGIYTGMTGKQMADLAEQAGNEKAADYDFGNGAINSSSTRKAVATSKFSGKSISGGWNRVGLWNQISYGEPFDRIISGGSGQETEGEIMIATTWAQNGTTVNMRKSASTGSDLVERIPIGETVEVLDKGSEWCRCKWRNKTGYIKSEFLIFGEVIPGEDEAPTPIPEGMIMVNREQLEQVYDMIGNLLGRKG